MASKIDICNFALRELGLPDIATLDTPTTKAQKDCVRFYPQAVSTVLVEAPWVFARRRRTLTSYTVPDIYYDIYDYAYVYPTDCAKLLRMYIPDSNIPAHYRIVIADNDDKILLCNVENATAEIVATDIDSTMYDPTFIEALSLKLMIYLAPSLRGSDQKLELASVRYARAIAEAQKTNKNEDQQKPERRVPWLDARRG